MRPLLLVRRTLLPATLLAALLPILGLLVILAERPASEAQNVHPAPAGDQTAGTGLSEEPVAAIQTAHKTSRALPPASVFPPPGSGLPGWIPDDVRSASPGIGQSRESGRPVPAVSGGGPALPERAEIPPAGAVPAGLPGGAAFTEVQGLPMGLGDAGGRIEPLDIPPMPNENADLVVCLTSGRVWGVVGARETVTVAVNGVQMGAARANAIGFFWTTLYDPDGNRPSLEAGDTVAIYRNGVQAASVTLQTIEGTLDHVRDVVSGTIGGVSTPISVTVYTLDDFTLEPTMTSYSQTVSTDDSGHFVADFSSVWDFAGWNSAVVGYVQNGVEVHRHLRKIPLLIVYPYPWNRVSVRASPGESLTITLFLSDGLTVKETVFASAWATGVYFAAFSQDILETDIVALELSDGTVISRTIDRLTATVDAASDRITGEARPGARVRGQVRSLTPQGYRFFRVSAIADSSGVYTLEFGTITDIIPGNFVYVFVDDEEGDILNFPTFVPLVDVHQTRDEVSGMVPAPPGPLAAGQRVTLTLYSAAHNTTYVYSKKAGWYGRYNFNPDDDGLPDIAPGDVVTVETEGYDWQGVVQVMTITVDYDADLDRFTGEVVSPTGRVELSGNYWQGYLYPAGGEFATLATASSPFTVTLSGFDVSGNLTYEVAHRVAGDHLERIHRQTDGFGTVPDHNRVELVLNPPGVAYTVTLYNSEGAIKAQVTGNSGEPIGESWVDLEPTGARIEPGDFLQVQSAAGFSHTIQIPALTVNGDPNTDIIYGQGPANSLLWVSVDNHGQGFVPTDSDGRFAVVVGQLQQLWSNGNLEWGDGVWLEYLDEQHTWVATRLELRAPDASIWKSPISGFARPGGKYVYQIGYWNEGNAAATDVVITDTLPPSTTYAGDTSGITPEIGADGVITWHLGDLSEGQWGIFMVTLDVGENLPEGSGALGANCAFISAPGDPNPGNDAWCTGPVDVWESDVGVNIDKWPNPNDPAPGQEFEYTIRWCAERGANFGPVWLTDTLPVSTTLLGWRTDWPWNMWTEVVTTGGQLVLYAPGLPGDWCQHIYLRLLLDPDVPPGTVLENTVVVTTPDDIDPGNNQETNQDARVGPPRYDMTADKWFGGVLVPGGWIRYGVSWWNAGNTAVHAWLTDTLPPGTSYQSDSSWHHDGYPFEPVTVTDEYVVWDLGVVGVVQGRGLDFSLDIGDTVAPGTVLTNCATVGTAEPEDTPWNNTKCVTATVNEPGPNLRIRKWSWWEGDNRIRYYIQFENIGDRQINNVWITDTLPEATTWDGWWDLQFDWSRLSEQDLSGNVLRWQFSTLYPGDSGGIEFRVRLDDPNDRPRWYTNTAEIDVPEGDVNPEDNVATTVDVKGEVERVEMWVGTEVSNMWGEAAPDSPVTVTTAYTQVTTLADDWGNWNIPNAGPVYPGDIVTVTAGAELLPVVIAIPDPFTAYASSITDTIWGQIDALAYAPLRVDLYGYGGKDARTDESGNYRVTWADVPRGGEGHVRYETTIDYAQVVMHRRFHTPDLILNVHYGHDWVEGNYDAGYTVLITVTTEGGSIKGTAVLTTGVVPWWWGGQTGFSTNWQGWTLRPDIVPGDWVYGQVVENGYTSTARVGTITGYVDSATDSITGTVDAPWLMPGPVTVECHPWGAPGGTPHKWDIVIPDGNDTYSCAWNPLTEWDVLPGQDIGVFYQEPDGDWVGNVFHEPSPNLSVDKFGQGLPAPGSNYLYRINYHNHGAVAATGVVITDTLPDGMTYITDTSGFPYTLDGNRVIWNLGDVEADTHTYFDVIVSVDSDLTPGTRVVNRVDIGADYDPYRWDNHHEWETEVVPNNPYLNVRKWAWTSDPVPGYDFVYTLNVCNGGSTGSSPVTLTDTLHLSTTLRYWWAREPVWSEVYSDAQTLVLSSPTIPAWQCYEVYVRAHLDENAWPGMPISNTAVISAANDLEDSDNEATWWGNVGSPHLNLNIDKEWSWGQLVPGGRIRYWVRANNNGNIPVTTDVHITDTLPVSTTFVRSWIHRRGLPPALITPTVGAGYVVWNVGPLDNDCWAHLEVELAVDEDAEPGTVLVNTAEIEPQPGEDNYDDNMDTWVETLYDHGPNLRVRKWGDWHGDRPGHAWYGFAVENVGDVGISRAVVTDTYPLSMILEGGVGTDWGRVAGFHHDADGHWFAATLENVHPGYRLDFNFNTTMDEVPSGLILTNTVEVSLDPAETSDADNTDAFVLTTGPDLYVEKTLVGGELLPGEVVTFSLRYGNRQPGHTWWWNTRGSVWITDTLPAGLEYITSTQRWCGGPDCPYIIPDIVENRLVFNVGPQNTGGWNEIYLTVRITDTVAGGDLLTNQVEIASDQPAEDTEPYYDNNYDESSLFFVLPRFTVGKVYATSGVAGTPVTYTLTVTNSGNLTGTNVVLRDAIPAGLAYSGSNGISDGTAVTWTFGLIAAGGGTASGWFSGILPCATGPITNADYRVVSSDQRVTSPPGAPVVLDIVAPTIGVGLARDPATVVVSQTVFFTATASTNGTPLSYAWDFGDGTTASGGLTVSHTYTRPGVYTATFTATDGCGYTGVATATVTVNKADTTTTITADEPDPSVVGQSVTVSVTVTSNAGTPTGVVSVTATGGGNPACQFTLSGRSGACALTFTAAGPVTITATYQGDANFNGSSDTEAHTVNPPNLVANFITFPSPASILVGDTVLFTDTSTTDGPPIVAWSWDFGDGGVSSVQHPTHTYNALGTFTVTLVVTDALGYSDTEVKPNLVTVSPRCIMLTGVTFTYTPPLPLVQAPVIFTATHTPADATQPITYTWDFGDGGTGSGAVVQHTYTVTGTHTVSVTAANPCTPAGVFHQESITIAPRRLFLPLVLRNYR